MRKPGAMLTEVLPYLFKRPATSHYPRVKADIPDRFRGMLVATGEKCIGCKLCVKDCPSGAIAITKVAEKEFEIAIDLARCIYCGQCADSCQRKVLRSSQEFELASLDRATLRVMVSAEPPAPGEECEPTAAKS